MSDSTTAAPNITRSHPDSRWHEEKRPHGKHSWACIPITEAQWAEASAGLHRERLWDALDNLLRHHNASPHYDEKGRVRFGTVECEFAKQALAALKEQQTNGSNAAWNEGMRLVERLREAVRNLDAALTAAESQREALDAVALHAEAVMAALERYGPSIVPHLLDTDDNAGERLRQALRALKEQP